MPKALVEDNWATPWARMMTPKWGEARVMPTAHWVALVASYTAPAVWAALATRWAIVLAAS
ncbi:unnamed protein product [Ilex paraguariensis]|uniref:Uncharacterized protein n=1 Tax=Ilex paraguariensis TaxID=185542 RepID=A0ABC8UE85_9AQUA